MIKRFIGVIVTVAVFASVPAMAVDNLLESVKKGCKKEIETYCKDVKPGQGRMLACFLPTATNYPVNVNMHSMMRLLN